jgi:hypothetical protein
VSDLSDFKRIVHDPMERELRLARRELIAERRRRRQLETALREILSPHLGVDDIATAWEIARAALGEDEGGGPN